MSDAHCRFCERFGHVAAHPTLTCRDVGCDEAPGQRQRLVTAIGQTLRLSDVVAHSTPKGMSYAAVARLEKSACSMTTVWVHPARHIDRARWLIDNSQPAIPLAVCDVVVLSDTDVFWTHSRGETT